MDSFQGYITIEELTDALRGLQPRVSEKETRNLMTEIASGRYGEMIKREDLKIWAKETEVLASIIVASNHD